MIGDPLDRRTFASRVSPADTFVHLVGTPRPSPAKAQQFREIDLVSAREAVAAAANARVSHFVYVSVGLHRGARRREALIRKAGLCATVLRLAIEGFAIKDCDRGLTIGDWGLGIDDWGLMIGD